MDDKGRIKYNNKAITKVLFEGDNLLGSDYSVGTRNISSAVVDKVEVIDNFINNPLLKGIIESDEMVINIRVDEKFKLDLSGSIDLGLGRDPSKLKYLGNMYIFNLARKTKSILIHNTNNVRKITGDINSYDSESKSMDYNKYVKSDFYNDQSLLQTHTGIGDQYIGEVFLNNGVRSLSRISLIHPLTSKMKINASANAYYENNKNKENETTLYFQANDTLKLLNSLNNDKKVLSQKYDAGTVYVDVPKGLSINTKSMFILKRNTYLSEINRSAIDLTQNNRSINYQLFNHIDLYKKIGTNLIEFYTDIKINNFDEEAIYSNPYFENELGLLALNQSISGNTNSFLTFIKILNRKTINYDISIGYKYSLKNINTILEDNNNVPISSMALNSLKRIDNDIFTEVYHFNKVKYFLYSFKSTIFYSSLMGPNRSQFFTKNFNFKSEFELPLWWRISFNAVYDEKLTTLDRVLINPVFIDLQTKFQGNKTINKPINKELTLSINKKNDFKGYYLNCYTSYISSNYDFGDQFNFDTTFIFTKKLFYPAKYQNFQAGSRFSLILDNIKSKFTISGNYNVNKGNNSINEIERFYTAASLSVQAEYFLTLKSFNINVKYNKRISEHSVSPINSKINTTTEKIEIKPIINFGKKVNFECIFTFNKFINQLNINSFFTSKFAINYKIKLKSLSNINLEATNLFNTKNYNLNYVTDYSLQNISFLGTPRFFYVTCTFDL